MQFKRVLGTACSIGWLANADAESCEEEEISGKGRIFGQGLNEFELKEDQIYGRKIWVFISLSGEWERKEK